MVDVRWRVHELESLGFPIFRKGSWGERRDDVRYQVGRSVSLQY